MGLSCSMCHGSLHTTLLELVRMDPPISPLRPSVDSEYSPMLMSCVLLMLRRLFQPWYTLSHEKKDPLPSSSPDRTLYRMMPWTSWHAEKEHLREPMLPRRRKVLS